MKITRRAPAKINLFLHMTGKREDGYHLLRSLMQTVSLYDEITVSAEPSAEDGAIHLLTEDSELSTLGMKNTVLRAAGLFMDEMSGKPFDITIELNKSIPSQAGLGGASSDAAATLMALSELFPAAVSRKRLLDLALQIGADVPFFFSGGTTLCEGVGEILTEATSLTGLPILLLKPVKGVSTPGCYARFDRSASPRLISEEEKTILNEFLYPQEETDPLRRLKKARPILWNDLYEPALHDAPEMADAIAFMESNGAVYAAMSGSGSTVFGVFEDMEPIRDMLNSKAYSSFAIEGWRAFPVTAI